VPPDRLAGHFHDTNANALQNIAVSLEKGLRVFDSSVAGLGGCPYAPGAKGNVATDQVLDLLDAKGFVTGIHRERLQEATAFAETLRTGP
jgi:hydroxymethylglutaryl-CoA lyase